MWFELWQPSAGETSSRYEAEHSCAQFLDGVDRIETWRHDALVFLHLPFEYAQCLFVHAPEELEQL